MSFTIVSSTCLGTALGPLATCTIAVQFAPTDLGAKTATLLLGATGTTASASLSGSSVALVSTLTTIAFGGVFDGDASDAAVVVTNPAATGTSGPITITAAVAGVRLGVSSTPTFCRPDGSKPSWQARQHAADMRIRSCER